MGNQKFQICRQPDCPVVKDMPTFIMKESEWIAALLDALKELGVEVPQWMPIDTAPKDGRTLVGYMPKQSPYLEHIRWLNTGDWAGWVYQREQLLEEYSASTHWMPS